MVRAKNLKRKELIPVDSTSSTMKDQPVEVMTKNKELDSKTQVTQQNDAAELVSQTQSNRRNNYLSGPEFDKRQKLKVKFDNDLKSLSGSKVHLIVFELGVEEYAFDLAKSREVVVTPAISRIPHTPEYIKGVAEIRGSVIEVFHLAQKFNLAGANEMKGQFTMVMQCEQSRVGILVEKVPTTLIVQGDEIKSASGIVADTTLDETYIKGIIKVNDRMIFYVDIQELIESDKMSAIAESH